MNKLPIPAYHALPKMQQFILELLIQNDQLILPTQLGDGALDMTEIVIQVRQERVVIVGPSAQQRIFGRVYDGTVEVQPCIGTRTQKYELIKSKPRAVYMTHEFVLRNPAIFQSLLPLYKLVLLSYSSRNTKATRVFRLAKGTTPNLRYWYIKRN